MKLKYLICLPTFNEKDNIAFMINEIIFHGHQNLIVSDANSTDGTAIIALNKKIEVLPRSGHGKGFAIKDALIYAEKMGFEALVLLDCDRTYPVEAIHTMLLDFCSADMVVGCRNFKDISFLRRIANHAITGFTNMVFLSRVNDIASGMRILRVNKFVGKVDAKYFDIEPQIHAIALKENMIIKEVSIDYRKRVGESKIGLKDLFIILYRIILERFR